MTRHELQKMTVIKLREEALKYPDLVGVHGMKKQELIDGLARIMGLPEEEKAPKKKAQKVESKESLKKKIRQLKEKRAEALEAKDRKKLRIVRRKIKKVKRDIRAIAAS